MTDQLTVGQVIGARRTALAIDLAAVAASLAANVAAAPPSVGGWAVAIIAPVGLFLAIVLWHRSHGILVDRLAHGFTVGLFGIAGGAAWISYGHLRHVAEAQGQGPTAAAIIPLVIDGAAVLATIVVISAGQRLAELRSAEEAKAEAAELEATARAERERVEREAAAAAEREADRQERERAAELEAERIRLETKAEARRERLTALQDRRQGVEATPAPALPASTTPGLEGGSVSVSTAPAAKTKGNSSNGQSGASTGRSKTSATDTGQAISDYLAEYPDATRAEVAAAIGKSAKSVQRWVVAAIDDHLATHPTASAAEVAQAVPGATVEAVEQSKPWAEHAQTEAEVAA